MFFDISFDKVGSHPYCHVDRFRKLIIKLPDIGISLVSLEEKPYSRVSMIVECVGEKQRSKFDELKDMIIFSQADEDKYYDHGK